MTAKSANALLDTVVSNDGVIRANAIATRGGTIYLDGGSTGVTSVTGTYEFASRTATASARSTSATKSAVSIFSPLSVVT